MSTCLNNGLENIAPEKAHVVIDPILACQPGLKLPHIPYDSSNCHLRLFLEIRFDESDQMDHGQRCGRTRLVG